ncbi:MAG: hypothetical protein V1726_06360 [Methanobacteriota archaeon]
MNKNLIKISITILIILISLPPLTGANPLTETYNDIVSEKQTREITEYIYRFGPDGSITPIPVTLRLCTGEEIENALFNSCIDHVLQDLELRDYLTESGRNLSGFSFIRSRGRGIIYDFTTYIPVKRFFKKYPNLPPFNRLMDVHFIHASYRRDPRATTHIRSFISGNDTIYTGSHSIDANNFIGYTTWVGVLAKRGFLFRCGFAGYALVNIS